MVEKKIEHRYLKCKDSMLDNNEYKDIMHDNEKNKKSIEENEEQNFVPLDESTDLFSETSLHSLLKVPLNESLETLSKQRSTQDDSIKKELTYSLGKNVENTPPINDRNLNEKPVTHSLSEQLPGLTTQDQDINATCKKTSYLTNTDQNLSYKTKIQTSLDSSQMDSKKQNAVYPDLDTSLPSKTMQETTQQDYQLLSDTPNPIPSSLDLQKLLASLSSVPKEDPKPATFQTTTSNPFSPNFLKTLNSVSSTTDTNTIQCTLMQQPNHKNTTDDHETPYTPQEDALFQKFLVDEKQIMSNTAPHEFPPGSRMFIGNLPTEKVTKKDVFRIFYPYGRLGQIALKQAYGFVQFFSSEECQNAINGEQGTMIRGRKMHLEVSKPQKHKTPLSSDRKSYRTRSRSPDIRDRSPVRGRNRNHGRGNHGYNISYDCDNKKDRYNSRDEFGKRPSPQSRYHKDRTMDYGKDCRSASPDRFRDYSQRQQADNFPLPRRYGNNVPECQIIVTDDTDRSFIYFVEKAFKDKGFRIDTLFLSPRLPLPSVVQQMIIEGIMAVIFLNRQLQSQSKISMQIFDRRANSSDVKFDEYANIDVHVAVVLAFRKKQSILQLTNTYGSSNYNNNNFQPQNAPTHNVNSDLVNLIGSLDPMTLQKVIGALTQSSQQLSSQTQHMSYTTPLQVPYQGTSIGQNYQINPGLMPLITPSTITQGQQPTQQIQDILGQLAKLQGQQR